MPVKKAEGKGRCLGSGVQGGLLRPQVHLLGCQGLPSPFCIAGGEGRPWSPGPRPLLVPLPGLGSLSPGLEASGCPHQLASQSSPTHGPAGQNLLHAGLSPADASPRLWPEPCPEQSPGHRCSHSLALDKLLGKITEPAFLNPPLRGEKRGPSLLRPQAPGGTPWGPASAADPCCPCLCGWLLSEGHCREMGGPREGDRGSSLPV